MKYEIPKKFPRKSNIPFKNPIEIHENRMKTWEKHGKTWENRIKTWQKLHPFPPRLEVQILLRFAGALRGLRGALRLALTDAGIASAALWLGFMMVHHMVNGD